MEEVRTAFHIPEHVDTWGECRNIDYPEDERCIGSQWVWETYKGQYNMIKVSGDLDAMINT